MSLCVVIEKALGLEQLPALLAHKSAVPLVQPDVHLVAAVRDETALAMRAALLLTVVVLQQDVPVEHVAEHEGLVALRALEGHDPRVRDGVGLATVRAEGHVRTLLATEDLERRERVRSLRQTGSIAHVHHGRVTLELRFRGEAFLAVLALCGHSRPLVNGVDVLAQGVPGVGDHGAEVARVGDGRVEVFLVRTQIALGREGAMTLVALETLVSCLLRHPLLWGQTFCTLLFSPRWVGR